MVKSEGSRLNSIGFKPDHSVKTIAARNLCYYIIEKFPHVNDIQVKRNLTRFCSEE